MLNNRILDEIKDRLTSGDNSQLESDALKLLGHVMSAQKALDKQEMDNFNIANELVDIILQLIDHDQFGMLLKVKGVKWLDQS